MRKDGLEKLFRSAAQSSSFEEEQEFIDQLLSSNEPETIDYHFGLLKRRENLPFYHRIRAAFEERSESGAEYLIKRIKTEKDPELKADALLLLGLMDRPEALPLARQMVKTPSPEIRGNACSILGWLGTEADLEILGACLLNDPDSQVRIDSAGAHNQMWLRMPKTGNRLLVNLSRALESEKDLEVLAWIIIAIQYILKKRYGLKYDMNEGTYSGNVVQAREKARAALAKRKA